MACAMPVLISPRVGFGVTAARCFKKSPDMMRRFAGVGFWRWGRE
jgi:hypothetical protein